MGPPWWVRATLHRHRDIIIEGAREDSFVTPRLSLNLTNTDAQPTRAVRFDTREPKSQASCIKTEVSLGIRMERGTRESCCKRHASYSPGRSCINNGLCIQGCRRSKIRDLKHYGREKHYVSIFCVAVVDYLSYSPSIHNCNTKDWDTIPECSKNRTWQ